MAGFNFPLDYPLASLVGQEVTQVCIGKHHIGINFYKLNSSAGAINKWRPGASIDIEAGFEFNINGEPQKQGSNENLGEHGGCLTALLGQHIFSVERLLDNGLVIQFSNDATLKLITDEQGFESYHLNVEGETLDVTKPWQLT